MKINQTDQLERLRQAEAPRAKPAAASGAFGDILAQKLGSDTAAAGTQSAAPAPLNVASLGTLAEVARTGQVASQTEGSIMRAVDSVLSQWETYAQQLGAPAGKEGLKQAYSELEKISHAVDGIKRELPGTAGKNIRSVVNELEVMTVTETFKFNRGDYLG